MTRQEKLYAPAAYVANTVLAGGAILSGVVFVYIIYLSTRGKHFTTFVAVFLYVFPAALAAVCLACLRLPASYRINVALFLLSTVASVYVVEIITTTWFSLPTVVAELREKRTIEAAKESGLRVDARTKLAVIADLRGKGIDAYPNFGPINLLTAKKNSNPMIALAQNSCHWLGSVIKSRWSVMKAASTWFTKMMSTVFITPRDFGILAGLTSPQSGIRSCKASVFPPKRISLP